MRGFGTRPRGHGDGVATLQYRALVGEAGQVAPQGYGYEVRGGEAPLGVNGPTRCPESSRSPNLRVSGQYMACLERCATHAARMRPPISTFCHISGACAPSAVHSVEIPGSPGPVKMAPAMPCVNTVLWVYKPKRTYHVTASDDTCYIQSRETEIRRAPRRNVTGRPVSGRDLVGRRERTCTGSSRHHCMTKQLKL